MRTAIVSMGCLVAFAAAADVSLKGGLAELTFGDDGVLKSIRETGSGRELVGEACPFMDVETADGKAHPATSLVREGDVFRFGFAPLAGEAGIRFVPFEGGWTIETVRFDVKDVKTWTIAHVKPGCKRWYGDMACLVSDERSGVALRAYDPLLRTACDEIPNRDAHSLYDAPDLAFFPTPEQIASGLMIRADAPDSFIGRRCGLCAGPRARLRDMLKAMTLVAGVPWSKAGGAWSLDAECNRGSYLFTTLMNSGSAPDWVEMLELGGFTGAHPYAWWVNYGLYDFNREILPNGLADMKKNCRIFQDAGYRVDLHHLSHCIQYIEPCFMPEVTVDPDDLVERCFYTLAKPFAPGDTVMYVNEKPWDGHTVIMKSHANGNALIIGREVIQYHAMSYEKPYCFSKISRGKFRTQYYGDLPIKVSSETFPVGTKVRYMQQRYGSFYPKPGSKLMEQVSSRIAEVFNACGANGVYFDGAEGMMTIYGTEKGRETTFRKFAQDETGIICESACLYPYSWWYRSRIGPWDHAEWGVKRFIDEHIRCLDEYATKANLLRVNLGWWGPMMGCEMARQHFSDEMEYNGCKGAAIDAADGFQLPDPFGSINTNSVHFHSEDQLAIFGWWERARMARALTDDVMEKIRAPGAEFRLRQDGTGLWRVAPQQVTAHAVKDAPYAAWTVDEPEARPAELRVEALYAGKDYRGEGSKSILAPADAPVLETKTAQGVTLDVSQAKDAEKGETLVLEATNANGFRDGAWARAGKRYPVPYLGVDLALGLWVKGDGSGALLNVQLEQAITCYHGYSEHYIRLDFTGWRYFTLQLRERDAYDFYNHKWPYSHYRINTATEVYRTEIMGQTVEYVNLYLNDVPAGGKARVEVTDVRSVGRCETTLGNGVVTLNGEDFAVPFEMKSTDVAELTDGVWTLINDAGVPVARRPAAKMPRVRKGANALAWRAEATVGFPRVEVTVLSVGDGEPAFNPGATASPHLAVEAERPLVHRPNAGLVARKTVRTRPGETAALELRILGPVDRPTVTVGGTAFTFPVKLAAANEILRCKDGRNWTVTRVDGITRPVVAKGELAQAIPPVTGSVEVSLACEDEANAAARLSILKRYRTGAASPDPEPPKPKGPEAWTFRDEYRDDPPPDIAAPEGTPWLENRISRCFFSPIKRPPFNRDELADAIDYYPDNYLERLRREGVNGLWLSVALDELDEPRLEKLRRVVDKCAAHSVKVWAFCIEPRSRASDHPFFLAHPDARGEKSWDGRHVNCPSSPALLAEIEGKVARVFKAVPRLAGMINIANGERSTTCLSFAKTTVDRPEIPCARCAKRAPWELYADIAAAMVKGMRAGNPEARLITWFYHPESAPTRGAWTYECAKHVPDGAELQCNFESGATRTQVGKERHGGDYWLSVPGPADPFRRMSEVSRSRGARLSAKIQTSCSHECATVPYVPVPGLLYRKFKGMRECGVRDVMMCWYFGNAPGLMNRAAGLLAYEDFGGGESAFLERLAKDEWGEDAATMGELWRKFSVAYSNYPLSNAIQYYGPFHAGFSWPLYPEISMRSLQRTWKPMEAPGGDLLGECLAEFSLEDAYECATCMVDELKGVRPVLERLRTKYANDVRRRRDLGVMVTLADLFESARDIFRFYILRREAVFASRQKGDFKSAQDAVLKMRRLLGRERELTKEMIPLCKDDSRLGFHSEAEAHQFDADYLAWRLGTLDRAERELDAIAAELAAGRSYPLSVRERTAVTVPAKVLPDGSIEISGACPEPEPGVGMELRTYDLCGTTLARVYEVKPEKGRFRVVIPAADWKNDERLKPAWAVIRQGKDYNNGGTTWALPDLPMFPEPRLIQSALTGDNFARIRIR